MNSICVGIDPGATTCIAVVDASPRPRLLGLWEVHGARHLWFYRLTEAVRSIRERQVAEGWPAPVAWVEDWNTKGKGKRKVSRANAWVGLGRAQGACLQAWSDNFGAIPHLVPVATETRAQGGRGRLGWANLLGLPHGKREQDQGRHRIAEATLHVDGARERIAEITAAGRQVDAAEAVLIAAAAAAYYRDPRRWGAL